MKGLLRKDFYVVRKNLLLMGLMFAIAGGFIAAITSPWILAILGAVMLGSLSVSTIISDKSAQWDRFSASLPVAGRTVVSSKYLLYGLLSLAGLLLGTVLAALLCLVLRSWDTELLWFQISVGITVSLLSGSISLSNAEAERYVEYVRQGGTLLLNTAYLKYFPAYESKYNGKTRQDIADGAGKVIVYGPDYSIAELDGILREQIKRYIPFQFSEDVQYLINVTEDSLIVTVINNDGVEKPHYEFPVIDESKAKDITITYTGGLPIKSVKELFYGKAVQRSGNAVKAHLEAGGYRVFEFVFD